mmetsp:Transcript_6211/g.11282  ORF Transcript_6211/g.11282 Transcript_6211/m.11282 type:complete len:402 (+) Transcript_6211:21-1226(+)
MSVKEGAVLAAYRFPALRALSEFLADFFSRSLAAWLRLVAGPDSQPLLQLKDGREAFEQLYSINEKIGQGSFGQVFSCSDRSRWMPSKGPLCVKVVPNTGHHSSRILKLDDEEQRELLSLFLQLRQHNLVRFHKFVKTSDDMYSVMDRYTGPELSDHVEASGGSLPADTVRSLAQQILSAVSALHAVSVMHRDIKLDNFRFKDEHAKTLMLLDLGFAKVASAEPAQHTVTGTLLYAAPEILHEGIYAHSCDLWSVGIVLFYLISGVLPFETSDVTILRSMHRDPVLNGDSLFRGMKWRGQPTNAKSLVRGLLNIDPVGRLSASAAADHGWFVEREDDVDGSTRRGITSVSSLRSLSSFSRSWNELRSLAGLKRSDNGQSNLAEAVLLDDENEAPLSFQSPI